jgi:hypothetical protein
MPSTVRDDEERLLIGDSDFEEDLRWPEFDLPGSALAFEFETRPFFGSGGR